MIVIAAADTRHKSNADGSSIIAHAEWDGANFLMAP
jgi:hypothetical protein